MNLIPILASISFFIPYTLIEESPNEKFFFKTYTSEEIIHQEISLGSRVVDTVFKSNPVTIRHGNEIKIADGEPKYSFVRPQIGYLPLFVEYTFDSTTKKVKEIYYDWEFERESKDYITKQKIWAREQGKLEIYSKEYERIKGNLILAMQLSNCDNDELKKIEATNGEEYWRRECNWKLSNSEIEIYLIYSSNTYRVRVHKKMSQ
jgi:hypothetical protein